MKKLILLKSFILFTTCASLGDISPELKAFETGNHEGSFKILKKKVERQKYSSFRTLSLYAKHFAFGYATKQNIQRAEELYLKSINDPKLPKYFPNCQTIASGPLLLIETAWMLTNSYKLDEKRRKDKDFVLKINAAKTLASRLIEKAEKLGFKEGCETWDDFLKKTDTKLIPLK